MKKILVLLSLIISSYFCMAQIEQTITLPIDQFGDTYPALLYLPSTYAALTANFPVIIFLHGAGESNAPLSNIYNSATAGGPAYFIEHGQWPASFTNPADGKSYQFIVISPQAVGSSWSTSGPQLNYMVQSLVKSYRVDVSRIYITGLSAGGAGIVQYMTNEADDGSAAPTPMYLPAAWVPMSEAFGAPNQTAMNVAVADGAQAWGFGDAGNGGSNDIHGFDTQTIMTEMNTKQPGIARFTNYIGGHCCWGTYYNPTYRETINGKNMSIYEWMLQFSHAGNPAPGSINPPTGPVPPVVVPPVTPPVVPPVTSGSGPGTVTIVGTRKYINTYADGSIYIDWNSTDIPIKSFVPGDTITFKASVNYGTVEFHGLTGAPGKPIVITNEGGQAWTHGYIKLYDCKYVHVDGAGVKGVQYGFKVEYHLNEISGDFANGVGLQISGRSKVVEVNNVYVHNTIFGMPIKQSPDCPDSLNYPNWIMDSISIHDNLIRNTNLEGMYIGDTAPDNGPTYFDPRYVIGCHLPAVLDTIYPRPIRSGHFLIYRNIVDTCGRGGIQLSGHSVSIAEIDSNQISHTGMNGDEQQGTGISVGMYTKAYIHDNHISNVLTWGIASLGGSGTNVPLRIENNWIDSCGYLYHYSNIAEQIFPVPDGWTVYSPSSGTPAGNSYDFANAIFVKTATNMDKDSTQFWIRGNKIGKTRAAAVQKVASGQANIQVFDYAATPMFQRQGNIVSGNTALDGATPATVYVDAGINYNSIITDPPVTPPVTPPCPVCPVQVTCPTCPQASPFAGITPAQVKTVTAFGFNGHWYVQIISTAGIKTSYQIF